MDNGLIFPYPSMCAHGEAVDTNHPKPAWKSSDGYVVWSVGPDSVVVKRWGDAGR